MIAAPLLRNWGQLLATPICKIFTYQLLLPVQILRHLSASDLHALTPAIGLTYFYGGYNPRNYVSASNHNSSTRGAVVTPIPRARRRFRARGERRGYH